MVMLWAACFLGFFGFMRAGEFTCPTSSHFDPESMLSPEDVSVDQHQSPSLLCVKLKCSKTDPFRAGVAIFLCYRWQLPHKRAPGSPPSLGLASSRTGSRQV